MDKPFNCWRCGACCKLVFLHPDLAHLDRGDGTCQHLQPDMGCAIYEDRPDACNTRTVYDRLWKDRWTWDEYLAKSEEACHILDRAMSGNS